MKIIGSSSRIVWHVIHHLTQKWDEDKYPCLLMRKLHSDKWDSDIMLTRILIWKYSPNITWGKSFILYIVFQNYKKENAHGWKETLEKTSKRGNFKCERSWVPLLTPSEEFTGKERRKAALNHATQQKGSWYESL